MVAVSSPKERNDESRSQEAAPAVVSNGHESSMIRIVGIQDRRPGGSVVKVSFQHNSYLSF